MKSFFMPKADCTLKELFASGRYNQAVATDTIRKMFMSLRLVHEENFVHGDVKPSNAMLDESTNSLLFIDIGLTRKFGEKSYAFGTRLYALPEFIHLRSDDDELKKDFVGPLVDLWPLLLIAVQAAGLHLGWEQQKVKGKKEVGQLIQGLVRDPEWPFPNNFQNGKNQASWRKVIDLLLSTELGSTFDTLTKNGVYETISKWLAEGIRIEDETNSSYWEEKLAARLMASARTDVGEEPPSKKRKTSS
jgi:serine/threonine protein kinase